MPGQQIPLKSQSCHYPHLVYFDDIALLLYLKVYTTILISVGNSQDLKNSPKVITANFAPEAMC